MNREYLQSLHAESKKEQATQIVNSLLNYIKGEASCGRTSYTYDITNTTFSAKAASAPLNPMGGVMTSSCLSSLSEFLVLLTAALGDCSVNLEVTDASGNVAVNSVDVSGNLTSLDASGNLAVNSVDVSGNLTSFDASGNLYANVSLKKIYISWA